MERRPTCRSCGGPISKFDPHCPRCRAPIEDDDLGELATPEDRRVLSDLTRDAPVKPTARKTNVPSWVTGKSLAGAWLKFLVGIVLSGLYVGSRGGLGGIIVGLLVTTLILTVIAIPLLAVTAFYLISRLYQTLGGGRGGIESSRAAAISAVLVIGVVAVAGLVAALSQPGSSHPVTVPQVARQQVTTSSAPLVQRAVPAGAAIATSTPLTAAFVEGPWSVAWSVQSVRGQRSPDDAGDTGTLIWRIAPSCSAGPCSLTVTHRDDLVETATFDGTRYRGNQRNFAGPPCSYEFQYEFQVTQAAMRGGVWTATVFSGTEWVQLRGGGACGSADFVYSLAGSRQQ